MGDRLKLDGGQMLEQADVLKDAIHTYLSFSNTPFDTELGSLDGMNTDFLAKFKTMLDDLNDSNPKLVEGVEEIEELTRAVAETFDELNESIIESMKYREE